MHTVMENQAHQNELQPRAVQLIRIQCPNEYFQKSHYIFADKHYTLFLAGNSVMAFLHHRDKERVSHHSHVMFILLIKTSTIEVM